MTVKSVLNKTDGSWIAQNVDITQTLIELVSSSEEWLIERILMYAKAQGYSKYTSTLQEAWRLSITGLSSSLIDMVSAGVTDLELGPDDDFVNDPAASFGVIEARRHRERGIKLGMYLGLMKYYRQTYKDLVSASDADEGFKESSLLIMERFFDRVEIGFCVEWSTSTEGDITTELQSANRRMTNEKNKYLTTFESLPDPVIIVDADYRIDAMNHPASLLFQPSSVSGARYYTISTHRTEKVPETHIGKPIEMLLPWLVEEFNSFIRFNAKECSIEKEIQTLHGAKNVNIRFSRMLDVSGKFAGVIIVLDDITDRKKTEIALRESEHRFRQLFNHMRSGVAVYEAVDEGDDFIIKDINRAGEKAGKINKDECIGKSVREVFPGITEMGLFEVFQNVWRTGRSEYHPVSLYQDDKRSSWYENDVYRLPSGEIVAVYGDVTEQKIAENTLCKTTEDLKHNIKSLQRANRKILDQQKSLIEEERLKVLLQMSGATAHELNQPLMALLGNIELMNWEKDNPDKVISRVQKIENAGQRIADIVKKIQTIRHYEVKAYAGNTEILNLNQKIHILSVDSCDEDYARIQHTLDNHAQIVLMRARGIEEALQVLKAGSVDLIFLDYLLPSGNGLDFLSRIQEKEIDTPVIFITAEGDEMLASQAIYYGAYDYFPKAAISRQSLLRVINNAMEKYRLKKEVEMTMEKMAEMSTRDELTGLYNRRCFKEVFERETASAQRYGTELVLCMMDLDHFKKINDAYGNPAGDKVLNEVAYLLRKNVRRSDIACRYGADEFAVILPKTDIEHAKVFCERYRQEVERHIVKYDTFKLNVTVSAGVAQFRNGSQKTADQLLKKADHALYLAKQEGRNRVVLEDTLSNTRCSSF